MSFPGSVAVTASTCSAELPEVSTLVLVVATGLIGGGARLDRTGRPALAASPSPRVAAASSPSAGVAGGVVVLVVVFVGTGTPGTRGTVAGGLADVKPALANKLAAALLSRPISVRLLASAVASSALVLRLLGLRSRAFPMVHAQAVPL